jgi:hypothetical protein
VLLRVYELARRRGETGAAAASPHIVENLWMKGGKAVEIASTKIFLGAFRARIP